MTTAINLTVGTYCLTGGYVDLTVFGWPLLFVWLVNVAAMCLALDEFRKQASGVLLSFFVILVWEILITPDIDHSNSWRGVWVSLIALPVSSAMLRFYFNGSRSFSFVYGCMGALLFVPRWLSMDRSALCLLFPAPSDEIILACWVLFVLVMGTCCCAFAALCKTLASF